ncbi:MAG TPA: thioredoxin family protein [Bacteroidales bacterium]|nr:thioredoxin family protein [Bacteroidales bacterium]
MKQFLVLFIIIIMASACRMKRTAPDQNPAMDEPDVYRQEYVRFQEASTWILGYFARSAMTTPPHSEWFDREYNRYELNSAVNKLTDISRDDISITVVMGSWCPDSRREVPRFLKILDFWSFPENRITFIGVDELKNSPLGEYPSLGIERVPTFIFFKNKIEAGRIIENPLTSLEQDMFDILTRE